MKRRHTKELGAFVLLLGTTASCNELVNWGELQKVATLTTDGGRDRDDGGPSNPKSDGGSNPNSDGGPLGPTCNVNNPFATPVPIDGPINTSAGESSLTFSGDELTLYFERNVEITKSTIFKTTRTSLTSPWETPQPFTSGTLELGTPSITADGLVLIHWGRMPSEGNASVGRIYKAIRSAPNVTFEPSIAFDAVNANAITAFPFVAGDASEVWVASNRDNGVSHLFKGKKVDDLDGYSTVGSVPELRTAESGKSENAPVLSYDDLTIFFGSDRSGGPGDNDIYMARRDTPTSTFGTVTLVPDINSPKWEVPSFLSHDGCRLYFISERTGNLDIYIATRPP